jgi:flagellar basal body-associated protein FliL
MKKLLLIGLPLLLLGGGGACAWFFLFNEPAPANAAVAEAEPAAAGEHGVPEEAVFVSIGEVIVPVYSRDKEDNFMVVKLDLQLTGKKGPDEVRRMMPRILDAYVTTLSTMAGRGEFAIDDSQRNARIKRALQFASDRVLGPEVIKEVLLLRAWQQPM